MNKYEIDYSPSELTDSNNNKGKHLIIDNKSEIDILKVLNKLSQYFNIEDTLSKVEMGVEYIVEIPTKFLSDYDAGKYFMMENSKTGVMWPTLMKVAENGKNEVVSPLPIKESCSLLNNPMQSLAMSLNSIYIQKQISNITIQLDEIYAYVKRIEQGQMDDREAYIESAQEEISSALVIEDEKIRQNTILSAIGNLSLGKKQIEKNIQRRIEEFEALPKSKFKQFFAVLRDKNIFKKHDEKYRMIEYLISLYCKATILMSASYTYIGEVTAANEIINTGIETIKQLDFSNVNTIKYIHKKQKIENMDDRASTYLNNSKAICIPSSVQYEYISIPLNGTNMKEALCNG